MIAFYVLPLYILANVLMYKSLTRWMKACSKKLTNRNIKNILIAAETFFSSALFIGFLLPSGRLRHLFNFLGNYWLGIIIYSLFANVTAILLWYLLNKKRLANANEERKIKYHRRIGAISLAIISLVSIYGIINARIIRTTNYDVTISKNVEDMENLKMVMVADMHLGYNIGYKQMEQMAKKINAQNPDIVIFAGDVYDNEFDAIDDVDKVKEAFKSIKSKYGTYAVYGNHDVSEKVLAGFTFNYDAKKESDIRMDELLKDCDIVLLRDEALLIDNAFYIYGRPDYTKLGRGIDVRKTPEELMTYLDKDKPVIVIDHQPRELNELANVGVDLDLSGHTHDGQFFPVNLLVKFAFKNSCGMKEYGNMTSIVTSGVGVYGPNMRVGTIAEITNININFGN